MSRLPVRTKPRRVKHCYVGPPAIFKLQQACQQLNQAWSHLDGFGCYLVGSCLERPVYDGKNAEWSRATPQGKIEMSITVPEAVAQFELGKQYFVDFKPAD